MGDERPVVEFEDTEHNRLHATWSRSGKRLILSVIGRGRWDEAKQVELDPEQVQELRTLLDETPSQ
jgi:hypothetical protein